MDIETVVKEIDSVVERLSAMREELLKDEPVFPDWAQLLVDERKCLLCREVVSENEDYVRGNDSKHSKAVMRAIERGELTEKEAIETGRLAPKAKPGRKTKTLAEAVDEATNSEKPLKKMPRRKKGKS